MSLRWFSSAGNGVERLKDEERGKEGQDCIPFAFPLHALASLGSFPIH
jgi:hypothetical protein